MEVNICEENLTLKPESSFLKFDRSENYQESIWIDSYPCSPVFPRFWLAGMTKEK